MKPYSVRIEKEVEKTKWMKLSKLCLHALMSVQLEIALLSVETKNLGH